MVFYETEHVRFVRCENLIKFQRAT